MLRSLVGSEMCIRDSYYTYNPLSTLTLVVSKNSRAYISDHSQFSPSPAGEFSFKGALELALNVLEKTEAFWSREILVVHNSLSTCDEGSVWDSIEKARTMNTRISVLSLSALVYVFHEATLATGGQFRIVKHMSLLGNFLEKFAQSGTRSSYSALIPVAFPTANDRQAPCACHLKMVPGYVCPICLSTVCSVPKECPICGYFLISTPHLAKAKLTLMPLQPFASMEGTCAGCQGAGELGCPDCQAVYCRDCENFIRKSLGKCLVCSLN